ncbi:2803_t:CDS:1, partial [Funneliformis geosporum]
NPIAGDIDNEYFQSFCKNIDKKSDIKSQILIPDLLGLNIYENAIYFCSSVSHLHDGIFLSLKKAYKTSVKMNKITKSLNKHAFELDKEFSNDNDHPNKKSRVIKYIHL